MVLTDNLVNSLMTIALLIKNSDFHHNEALPILYNKVPIHKKIDRKIHLHGSSEISECFQLYISGILENCVLEFQSNIVAADKIETTPDKNVVMPPVPSPSFCLLLQKTQFKVGQKL